MNKHILVIDDDIGIRESLFLVLNDAGYQVDTVESGEQGIEKVKRNNYDLIFLDIKMAGMDGIQTLREIRRMGKKIPVYIITAFQKEYFRQLEGAMQDGVDFEVIEKPFDRKRLLSLVEDILEIYTPDI
ncbi:response regulator [Candidatus Aerophobetes bacterium Ae_b3a]|nr:MAG: response regulator [Candidatus Aerophobetes bacterium Ae_b3a]